MDVIEFDDETDNQVFRNLADAISAGIEEYNTKGLYQTPYLCVYNRYHKNGFIYLLRYNTAYASLAYMYGDLLVLGEITSEGVKWLKIDNSLEVETLKESGFSDEVIVTLMSK